MEMEFYILPGRFVPKAYSAQYLKAYETFHETWSEAFQEIYGQDFIHYSNDFTRQDYIQALFMNGECIALDCVRKIDLENPADRNDSWFRSWRREHLDELTKRSHGSCLVNSYFTVKKEHRKSNVQDFISVSYLMGCLSVLHQLELGVPTMLGMMRNNRSMNSLGAMLGSQTVEENVIHNGLPTDLVYFSEEAVKVASRKFPKLAFDVFNSKTNYFSDGVKYAKAA